ncbi:hypothetical protein QBC36DRAFT_337921 [Triangularia setosa]|uniref:Uncharacterized protein n=1 Tax=Triangularia setosa TaxID=2587417 RepID=A0AAN7A416_9PEZI|nr:hypothetical protein QBC36DRAFT_337921 [Podospora setosa]
MEQPEGPGLRHLSVALLSTQVIGRMLNYLHQYLRPLPSISTALLIGPPPSPAPGLFYSIAPTFNRHQPLAVVAAIVPIILYPFSRPASGTIAVLDSIQLQLVFFGLGALFSTTWGHNTFFPFNTPVWVLSLCFVTCRPMSALASPHHEPTEVAHQTGWFRDDCQPCFPFSHLPYLTRYSAKCCEGHGSESPSRWWSSVMPAVVCKPNNSSHQGWIRHSIGADYLFPARLVGQ